LAQEFVIGAVHTGTESAALALGDNIFFGPGLGSRLSRFRQSVGYGVVEFNADRTALAEGFSEDEQLAHPAQAAQLRVRRLPAGADGRR
jgi:hypothetical protein